MTDRDIDSETGGGTIWRWLGLVASVLGTIMALGVVTGFSAAALEQGWSGFTLRDGAILAAILAVTGGLGWLTWRLGRKLLGSDAHVPSRERRSRNILFASCGLGLVTGILLSASDMMSGSESPISVLSDSAMSPVLAITITLFLVIVLPVIGWHWHKVIDEHERQAYQVGAVVAAYLYLVLAPVWWLLWRGGLVPQPDGIIIYFAFNFAFLIVWFWKKYR